MIGETTSVPDPADSGSDKATETKTKTEIVTETRPKEIGGREALDPTRYGDWEKNGRCIDF